MRSTKKLVNIKLVQGRWEVCPTSTNYTMTLCCASRSILIMTCDDMVMTVYRLGNDYYRHVPLQVFFWDFQKPAAPANHQQPQAKVGQLTNDLPVTCHLAPFLLVSGQSPDYVTRALMGVLAIYIRYLQYVNIKILQYLCVDRLCHLATETSKTENKSSDFVKSFVK